ncbi:MAG: hypothetical protein RSB77_05345 [Bacilli bacterium]
MKTNKDISLLNFNKDIHELLLKNDITTVNDLWVLKRIQLKEKGFSSSQIKQISIQLQLKGLDLNKRTY